MTAETPSGDRATQSQFRVYADRHSVTLIPYAVLLLMFAIVSIRVPGFATPRHIGDLLVVGSFIGVAALGQSLVIFGGGLDLSVPYVLSGAAIELAIWSQGTHHATGWQLAIAAVLLGGAIGAVNGIGVAFLGIPPIIMTLAVGGILSGILLQVIQGSISPAAPSFAVSLATDRVVSVPIAGLVWVLLALLTWFVLSRTTYGRRLYSIGTNPIAARFSGIHVSLIIASTYIISGATAGFAGIMLSGYIGTAYLDMGTPYLFSSIAAVAVGGASILGGRGTYWGSVAGALILTVLGALLPLLGLSQAWLKIVYGLVILVAVFIASRAIGLRVLTQ